jgi:RNA exonuclease 4
MIAVVTSLKNCVTRPQLHSFHSFHRCHWRRLSTLGNLRNLPASTSSSSQSSTSQQPPTPPLTRLQREAQKLVAIDVEYAHICTSTGQRYQLPAEICLVDYEGKILFKSFCNGFDAYNLNPETLEFEFKGGIPRREWLPAPKLKEIKPKLIQIISEKEVAVVGHNLGKDLTSLGLDKIVPLTRRRDTMRYPALQGPSGFGRTLAELARKKLNRKIQVESRHDPAEDAIAAMDLYLEYCHYDPNLMEYDDLVEYYASQIIKPCSVTD